MNIINPMDNPELLRNLKDYGFNLKKDLKDCNISGSAYISLLGDFADDCQSNKFGIHLYSTAHKFVHVYKSRHKDSVNNRGKSSGFRIICIVQNNEFAYIIHIYSKSSGKHPKANTGLYQLSDVNPWRSTLSNVDRF